MLDRKSKKVLKALLKCKDELSYVNGSNLLTEHLPKKYTIGDIEKTLLYLDSKGLIECQVADDAIYDIYVTYEAENYKEFNWLEFKKFVLKSVFVPIFVAFITSLITALVTYYFKR